MTEHTYLIEAHINTQKLYTDLLKELESKSEGKITFLVRQSCFDDNSFPLYFSMIVAMFMAYKRSFFFVTDSPDTKLYARNWETSLFKVIDKALGSEKFGDVFKSSLREFSEKIVLLSDHNPKA